MVRSEQPEHPGGTELSEGDVRPLIADDQGELGGQALAAQRRIRCQSQREAHGASRPGIERESETGRIARGSKQPCGVLDERKRMQHRDAPLRECRPAAERIEDPVAIGRELDGHRVDGEVTPAEVLADAGRHHAGQRSGRLVALGARRGDVHAGLRSERAVAMSTRAC